MKNETQSTDESLIAIQKELSAREPIFHQPEFGTDRKTYESMTVEDFFEIGASGKRYSRNFVIDTLVERYSKSYSEDWETSNFYIPPGDSSCKLDRQYRQMISLLQTVLSATELGQYIHVAN